MNIPVGTDSERYVAEAQAKKREAASRRLRTIRQLEDDDSYHSSLQAARATVTFERVPIHQRYLSAEARDDSVTEPHPPPAARLASRCRNPSSGELLGRPLRLHLAALAVGWSATRSGRTFTNKPATIPFFERSSPSWGKLAGIPAATRAEPTKQRLRETCNVLAKERLIGRTVAWDQFLLLDPDGSGEPWYHVGNPTTADYAFIPAGFWTNGWYLLLTPAETLSYLALTCHLHCTVGSYETATGFSFAESDRQRYGITRKHYALQRTLEAFGLITIVHDANHPKGPKSSTRSRAPIPDGFEAAPRRINWNHEQLEKDAIGYVTHALRRTAESGSWHPGSASEVSFMESIAGPTPPLRLVPRL